MHDNSVKTEIWSKEKIEAHLKAIKAGPPPKKGYVDATITGAQMGFNGKYIKKGGASW
jgi:hypothetical protein